MWLPETAVDIETLETLAEYNIKYTILSPRQCIAVKEKGIWRETPSGRGLDVTVPYICRLPSGRSITIVFYHGSIANQIAFGGLLENGDSFRDALLGAVKIRTEDRLLVVGN